MGFLNVIKHIVVNFRRKHRVSFRDPHSDKELWCMFFSPLNILLASLTVLIITFVAVMTVVAYTPILDLIPGYPGNKSRQVLLHSVMRLDSLERQIKMWQIYERDISLIMEGKRPISVTASATVDSILKSPAAVLPPSLVDSLFRASMGTSGSLVVHGRATDGKPTAFELYAPSRGVVVDYFDPSSGSNGVTVSVSGEQPIVAVTDGVMVLSTWSPAEGYITQLQHGGSMLSVYKRLSRLIKKPGDRVKAGEVIGYVGGTVHSDVVSPEGVKTSYNYELWDNGTPVDPESYMLF
ncbi:MAG: M23 family metallopeptidase [Rikenellaceae bacterium]|nr:M23 family metallopeptidase [Rikenellaceae bacterium]MDE7356271.1 M23 family metallopeptidase [Rikenellaceae bacterium]